MARLPETLLALALLLAPLHARAEEPTTEEAPVPSPDPPSAPAASPPGAAPRAGPAPAPQAAPDTLGPPAGAVVVALGEAARPHARALARLVYGDNRLRPKIDEPTAQVLAGGDIPADRPELVSQQALRQALENAADDETRRRLAASLARDVGARLLVLVSSDGGEPIARVLRMPEEQFLAVRLTPRSKPVADGAPPEWDWADAGGMLRELAVGPEPGPRQKPKPNKKKKRRHRRAAPVPVPREGDDDDGSLLTSPWFWGGLGVVVTVGVTVLILSQTALNEPDTVSIEGRVPP